MRKSINLRKPESFSNSAALTFMHLVLDEAEALTDECLNNYRTVLDTRTKAFSQELMYDDTKKMTAAIQAEILGMDNDFYSVKEIAGAMERCNIADMVSIATSVSAVCGEYTPKIRRTYAEKAAAIKLWAEKLEGIGPENLAKIAVRGLVEDGKQLSEKFITDYKERNSYREARKGKISALRADMQSAFEDLGYYVELKAFVGDEAFGKFAGSIETYYTWIYTKHKSDNDSNVTPTSDEAAVEDLAEDSDGQASETTEGLE